MLHLSLWLMRMHARRSQRMLWSRNPAAWFQCRCYVVTFKAIWNVCAVLWNSCGLRRHGVPLTMCTSHSPSTLGILHRESSSPFFLDASCSKSSKLLPTCKLVVFWARSMLMSAACMGVFTFLTCSPKPDSDLLWWLLSNGESYDLKCKTDRCEINIWLQKLQTEEDSERGRKCFGIYAVITFVILV